MTATDPVDRREVWPLAGLRIVAPRVTLAYADDELAHAIADAAALGIHPEDEMPFAFPWTRVRSPAELRRSTLQSIWRSRGTAAPEAWSLPFAVLVDGVVVGRQDVDAEAFGVRRTVATGSWLAQPYQGRGIGAAMREAALALAFGTLGAERAETSAFADNPASAGVSRKLGYRQNGSHVVVRDGVATVQHGFVMERGEWEDGLRAPARVEGWSPAAAALLGVPAAAG